MAESQTINGYGCVQGCTCTVCSGRSGWSPNGSMSQGAPKIMADEIRFAAGSESLERKVDWLEGRDNVVLVVSLLALAVAIAGLFI